MTERERLEQRLAALERTVIDGDGTVDELAELAELAGTVERLESRIDEQEQRLARVEARAESLTGFVDDVESVNRDVERQAAAAVATVDRLERRLDDLERADSIDSDRCRDRQLAEATTGAGESAARENGSVTPESTVAEIVGSEDENGDGDEATAGIGNSDGDETAESTGVIATIRKTLP
ncbi:hypothetical protein RBH26_10670 [Natronolimnohabitans sp. A-GB9]|uniref:DUF7310 family coiled-coil domain-containing protein n=1 Tax=Natronolimnohabitans sp. A-GB9 TaxID=3069757 RepID=UPI0027B68B5A|nr:hypothetical protein [Natronolimnohabitans sp. A-GB9]MDQ2050944.1 hypothetical protein [Natronolimnohabitans sp. A-GB9]